MGCKYRQSISIRTGSSPGRTKRSGQVMNPYPPPTTLLQRFNGLPEGLRSAITLIVLGVVVFVDLLTPPPIFMTGFYLLPIGLAVWYSSQGLGVSVVVLSTIACEYMVSIGLPPDAPSWQIALAISSPVIVFISFSFLLYRQRIVVQKLLDESRSDPLTGVRNRRAFIELAQFELSRISRSDLPATLALIDLDNFKFINDSQGHAVGDALLIAVSRCMAASLRQNDIYARIGGDEFVVLLPETDAATARYVLGRLHGNLRTLLQSFGNAASTSIGAVVIPLRCEADIEAILARADETMYAIKRTSKDALAFDEVALDVSAVPVAPVAPG